MAFREQCRRKDEAASGNVSSKPLILRKKYAAKNKTKEK
jgi:hypothetical protein